MKKQFALEVLAQDADGGCAGCSGGQCPTIYQGSDGEIYVQGYVVAPGMKSVVELGNNEDVVRISARLVEMIKAL